MTLCAATPGYPPRCTPRMDEGQQLPAPWITLLRYRFHAIVTDVSRKRDRDFTESVTD
jgi:hypothetical protein